MRRIECTVLISRDLVAAFRRYSFENLTEFYRRYSPELRLAKSTFLRAMRGEYVTPETAASIETLARRLRLVEKDACTGYLEKSRLTVALVRLVDRAIDSLSLTDLSEVREFLTKNRAIIIS